MAINVYLAEAADKVKDINTAVSDIKSHMNKCKLTKFKSAEECVEFFIVFFTNSTPDGCDELSFNDWFEMAIDNSYSIGVTNKAHIDNDLSLLMKYDPLYIISND